MVLQTQFNLSLSGGILILAGGILSLIWLLIDFTPDFDPLADIRRTIGEEEFKFANIRITVAGLSSGIAVIMTSWMLRIRPQESKRWGIMIIILSSMSILGMGGFFLGMALGITGGILAIKKSKELQFVETEEKKTAITKPVQENLIFRCSACSLNFKNDEELRNHIIGEHRGS